MPSLDAAFTALQNSGGDKVQQALLAQKSAAEQPFVDKLKETASTPLPAQPEMQKQPDAPKAGDFGTDAQQYTTAMSVLSALTGAFSRQHATTALNAFGAGIKGYKDGNVQAFDEAHKQWKDASEAAIANNKTLTDKYKQILDDRKLTEEEQMNSMKAIAEQYHDNLMAASTSISQAVSIYDSQVKAAATAQAHHDSLQAHQDLIESAKLDPDAIHDIALQANAGDYKGMQNAARGPAAGFNVAAIKNEQARLRHEAGVTGADQAKTDQTYTATQHGLNSLQTRSAQVIASADELDRLIPQAQVAIKDYQPGQFKSWNQIENMAADQINDPKLKAMVIGIQGPATAYTSMLVRNGVPTDAARAKTDAIINPAMASGNFDAAFRQMQIEGKAVKQGLSDASKDIQSGGAASTSAPGGVDPDLWEHATPEEKALWQTPSQ